MLKGFTRAAVVAIALSVAASGAFAQDAVRVGSKIDTEGALLGHMIIQLLESKGVKTANKLQLGPTKIVRSAIVAGEIDLYPEYTGNGAFFFSIDTDPAWKSGKSGYEKVKTLDAEQNKLVWLQPAPANNTWAIAVRKDVATANKLSTMEDFAKWVAGGGKVKVAASAEFVESPAALPSFEKTYGFRLAQDQVLVLAGGNTAATERAAAEQTSGVNAAMAYGTDGALAALGLVVMSDPKGAQIVYQPAPLVRASVLDKHPAIKDALEPVFASLDLSTLQTLNAKIAVEGQDAKQVAAAYLKEKGFLK
ncbi:MAG TPA: ABC transporter substrate-binding protein [Alphaproteobacteria bacterium]|nr:ABC transporter substrate-binding protein [Alphaproteobacteria bacterium]